MAAISSFKMANELFDRMVPMDVFYHILCLHHLLNFSGKDNLLKYIIAVLYRYTIMETLIFHNTILDILIASGYKY